MENKTFTLLLVDDEPDMLSSLMRMFRKKEYLLYTAGDGRKALQLVREHAIDAAVIDMKMPGMDGMELLRKIKEESSAIQVVILTGYGAVEQAVEAMKLGAVDFIEKPLHKENLLSLVEHLEKICRLENENRNLKEQMDFTFGFDRLVGNSSVMLKLKQSIKQIGPSDSSVLILGETGTGKELIAQAIHRNSLRNDMPFVPVDCAAITESMMESELFGHVKGSFTGALNASEGLIRAANGGTLFFDEIGELPVHVQSKLLRTLQQREVRPVGSTRTFPVDVRIIAATNRNLEKEVKAGSFREDLYYRLNVISLIAPPLRKRTDDIPTLVKYFLKKFAIGGHVYTIELPALRLMEDLSWPGNVRELENSVRRLIAFATGESIRETDVRKHFDVPADSPGETVQSAASAAMPTTPDAEKDKAVQGETLEAYEKTAIINALAKCSGRRKDAAEMLGIGEATLYRKIKQYSL